MDEFQVKQKRVRNFLKERGLKGVFLSRQSNFSWITCGGDSHVVMGSDFGVASVLATEDKNYIITNNIEVRRIKDEEIVGARFIEPASIGRHRCRSYKFKSHMWYQEDKHLAIIKKICPLDKLGSDVSLPGAKFIGNEFSKLRYSLTPDEITRYQWLGEECGKSMGRICHSIKLGDTENEIAGRLAEDLLAKGIVPTVLLIAADDRISKYRHPIPTDKKVKKYVMVVLCGRKWGLIVSLTRLVHFGKISRELRYKHDAVAKVDACFIAGTKPGIGVADVFKCAVQTYREAGFANEWKLHHQGGATGYEGRDYKGTLACKEIVQMNQAFAWNPSITGTKSEDTIIAFPDETKIISSVPNWPTISAECCGVKIKRPDILIK